MSRETNTFFEPKSLIGEPKRKSLFDKSEPQKAPAEQIHEEKSREQQSLNLLERKQKDVKKSLFNNIKQSLGAAYDMGNEYFKMKSHNYKGLDDYHHCKANYNAASRGEVGYNTAKYLGALKEDFDYYKNMWYKGLSEKDAKDDKIHDLSVNADGRLKGISRKYKNAKDACAEYRKKNPGFPEEYW